MSKGVRGEIWQTRFVPNVGAKISKDRPAVVINTATAGRLPLSIVVPITDWKDNYEKYFWFVRLNPAAANGLSKSSGADAFQVKSVSDERLIQKLGILTDPQLQEVALAVGMCVGI
jgi:mRNA interferase MazF